MRKLVEYWDEMLSYHEKLDYYWIRDKTKDVKKMWKSFVVRKMKDKNSLVLVVTDKNKVVAYFLGYVRERPNIFKYSKAVYISDAFVAKDYRKKGLARRMTKEFVKWAKKKKINLIELQVSSKNIIGIKSWKKIGFKEIIKTKVMEI